LCQLPAKQTSTKSGRYGTDSYAALKVAQILDFLHNGQAALCAPIAQQTSDLASTPNLAEFSAKSTPKAVPAP
jgi:hypothetical protein